MFGAPPVGHVMDSQFKPVFFWGYGEMKFICTYPYTWYYVYQWQALGAYTRSLDLYFL